MSWDRWRGVGAPQIVCLLETKIGEDETSNIRASGRGVERCPLDLIWVVGGKKKMNRNDEDKVLVLCCSEQAQDDCSTSMGQGCNSETVVLFGRGCRCSIGVVGGGGKFSITGCM